jgi:NadR type nicotinamide-nucleotide adenylyltransferase
MAHSKHQMKRLVITGSECTGKTTLAAALATHYDAPLAAEFVRDYALAKGKPIDAGDHWSIVRGQVAAQDDATARAERAHRPLVVFDTDLLSTVAYAWHYTGQCSANIEQLARERLADHYLLLDIDVPWIADGVRDRGDQREDIQALFRETLERFGAPYTIIRGSWDERLALATGSADALLHHT